MTSHEIGTREQWAAAYAELRAEEKELTRRGDALARKRQALLWVPVTTEYRFETNAGTKTLAELFDGRSQLIVRHFMHGPKTPEGWSRRAWAGRSSGSPPRTRSTATSSR